MKKRILSILLILCMVLMLCPATAFAETPEVRYSLIIKFDHGTYRGCTGSYNRGDDYKTGDKYDVTKDFNEIVDFAPYVFVMTRNTTGTFTKSDMVAEFIFAMPEYSIDIEVSGYAVGNTPADCKIDAITSTIPDVSFDPEDKNDVLDIVWIDVDAGKTMSDTDVFQAEGTYEIDVTLAHKDGISVLPLATVDGKLCRHCRQWGDNEILVACYMEKPASQYTITYDGGEGVEGSIAVGTKNHGENFTLSSDTFTRAGYEQIGWATSDGGEKVYDLGGTYTANENITLYPVWSDITKPTGEISIGTKSWKTFLNNITFDLFFKDTQTVTITASDNSGEAVKIEYLLSDKELDETELATATFTAYTKTFSINPDNKYVIYAKLTDHAGNVTYISSEGVVLDATAPVIKGLENGKTYCSAQTVTVTEDYIESVKVNGTEVPFDASNQFILNPTNGTQTVVVTDKAGNETSVTVTVNNGHTAGNDDNDCSTPVYCIYHPNTVVVKAKSHDFSGEWQNDSTDHWHICQNAGCTVAEPKASHSGTDDGDCTTAVICECGYTITAANAEHTYEWQDDNGQYWRKCQSCGDETAKKDIPTITINGADAVCVTQDYKFSFTLPEGATDPVYGYEFENKGDLGLPAIIENNELFGIVPVTEYEPSENSFKVYAGAKTADGFEFFVSKTVALMSEHTDAAPKDHICDICGATLSEHTGGEATCRGKAICEYCGEEYGEKNSSNHTGGTETRDAKSPSCTEAGYTGDIYCMGCGEKISAGTVIDMLAHNLEKIPTKDATVTETGNKEYWRCKDCGKYFANENGKTEIELNDTVTKKLQPEIIKGKVQSIVAGEKKELTFRSNAAFGDFICAQLDGKTLDAKNYTVKEGSTVVTLKDDYVATLSAGEHTIGIVSESGTATTTFTVNAKAVVDNETKSPQTGDNNYTVLWIALFFVSGAVVFGTTIVRTKKNHGKH